MDTTRTLKTTSSFGFSEFISAKKFDTLQAWHDVLVNICSHSLKSTQTIQQNLENSNPKHSNFSQTRIKNISFYFYL